MSGSELLGSCLCGAVRFRVKGPWQRFHHCHCSRCRQSSGAAHTTTLFVARDGVEWLSGEDKVKLGSIPAAPWRALSHCAQCGSPLPKLIDEDTRWGVPAGSLDQDPEIRPEVRIF